MEVGGIVEVILFEMLVKSNSYILLCGLCLKYSQACI